MINISASTKTTTSLSYSELLILNIEMLYGKRDIIKVSFIQTANCESLRFFGGQSYGRNSIDNAVCNDAYHLRVRFNCRKIRFPSPSSARNRYGVAPVANLAGKEGVSERILPQFSPFAPPTKYISLWLSLTFLCSLHCYDDLRRF